MKSRYIPQMKQAPERPVAWTAETVWAAAAYAHRVNGSDYLKNPEYTPLPELCANSHGTQPMAVKRNTNRHHMQAALNDSSLITDSDRELGVRARDYISKQILVKALKGRLSEFEETLQRTLAQDDFDEWHSRMELAVVASQIRSYEQAVQLEEAMSGISRDPVGAIGDKVEADITVVKSVYSQNYGVYFITGVTADRRAVFFSYRERLANGHQCHVKGTVKAHRENSTQLNRVRIA